LENSFKFLFHPHVIEQAPARIVRKGGEKVYITVGAEIVSQDGAKQRQLPNLPPAAECNNLVHRDCDGYGIHASTLWFANR
jgi:hypothetical protein